MTYLRILAVVLMILAVFALLSSAILIVQAHFAGASRGQLLLLGAAMVVVPGLLIGTASLLEWLAGSAARRQRSNDEPLLPVRWGAGADRFATEEQGNGICPDEPRVRE